MSGRVRIVTYNVHKCRGLDGRVSARRIAAVLARLDADVIALQEVLSIEEGTPDQHQARYLAEELGYAWRFGENRRLRGGAYGNVTLSRLPIQFARNYDLTWRRRERRGCLRCDVRAGNSLLHVFNVHLGTSFFERRGQGPRLASADVLLASDLHGPRVVVGDFNEWTRGLASRLMAEHFDSVDIRVFPRYGRSYPGVLPLLRLDHFYFDDRLVLEDFRLVRNRTALVASDHLPLVVDFGLAPRERKHISES